ncbi:bifunctional dTDP-4-dehydrorhamnose 3,5-epimerase family protein/NAD(P)-dependent oxidoreductase [Helcobacillus massiliensis]|uniref:bifunctional dTDP-4-dehydrorhamnose 3,5-epimerase family protein/NAD(P)-dependent oxidoreductase n=1 Tax=Helcobacillus massiliensis TaxID=521392 RepID=UPI0025566DCB|nr:bifunctional dTDP-4-dehydrorhamnose 3,5-epimerase family protein/NAD(P)-dependent oxidoreductase [Helcobacillus massiliensis]MDK7743078.1 bifunctional dTDP-4-dehydrorhamnose 3,5-epimerase family protein/NAD(P)-dependent oxidoreductase [Helcobacillus massiliensis]WOO92533.1 bifunctional dTDP-4-dehydrorhamnose 3,5-epimerase family protein/NAD(P)-dependent oxidoreductase [Helcobacillus massiliensis]
MAKPLSVHTTPIPGLLVLDLPVHGDARGWFKENWQREKMTALGLPDFGPVQNNISFNQEVGVTRGIHAEPWDKFISVATGRVFGAWVDLREGDSFGAVHTQEITPNVAVFVPAGVGNSFQTLEAPAAYTYLVNDHWSEQAQTEYTFLNLADETAAIDWPIPLKDAELSEKDRAHPMLGDVTPMRPSGPDAPAAPGAPVGGQGGGPDGGGADGSVLVIGANGQLGRALRETWAGGRRAAEGADGARRDVRFVTRDELDLADVDAIRAFDFTPFSVVVNAAAYTAVDTAETPDGRAAAWAVNARGVAELAAAVDRAGGVLVHVSTDYVFDGSAELISEDDPVGPLGVYGQSKAAGDAAVSATERHYLLRTSWVVGDGANFVRTMASLAEKGVDPSVVDDQNGRLTFTTEIVRAIDHLLETGAEYGTYNVSCGGKSATWCEVARRVFELTGHDPARVSGTSTTEYFASKPGAAPRPLNSVFDLSRLEASGFEPRDQWAALAQYLQG